MVDPQTFVTKQVAIDSTEFCDSTFVLSTRNEGEWCKLKIIIIINRIIIFLILIIFITWKRFLIVVVNCYNALSLSAAKFNERMKPIEKRACSNHTRKLGLTRPFRIHIGNQSFSNRWFLWSCSSSRVQSSSCMPPFNEFPLKGCRKVL